LLPTVSSTNKPVKPRFPFLDLKAQFATIRAEVMEAVTRVLESQVFILGAEVDAFEREFAPLAGGGLAISCASGTDALLLALMALDVGAGDEVIVPPFTFVATAGVVARLGAKPVFVDIDAATYNLDPALLEEAITPRTRAMIPVHLFGLAADMDAILAIARRHRVSVIEDAAQAVGARYRGKPVGNLGNIGCFSFFPSKNLGGAGDGGMLTTMDPSAADRLRVLRMHGSRSKYDYELLGINSRLDALQAAILRVKQRYLEQWTSARQRNAATYIRLFEEHGLKDKVRLPMVPPDRVHVFHQFVIGVRNRDALRAHLQDEGFPTEIYYPSPLHLQPAFRNLGYQRGDFPRAEAACEEVLALPIFPELREDQQRELISAISDFAALI